jgi:hypothetical protein
VKGDSRLLVFLGKAYLGLREHDDPSTVVNVATNVNTLVVTAEIAHQIDNRVKEAEAKVTELFQRKESPKLAPKTQEDANGN